MSAEQSRIAWVLEAEAFPRSHEPLEKAIVDAGQRVIRWDDEWWSTERWPLLAETAVIFHGSLGNAQKVRQTLPWKPGAYCAVDSFRCSAWYPGAADWLIHREWRVLPANALVNDPVVALEPLGRLGAVFVRPDSPLKPFAGRVLRLPEISLAALDHGFYYDDPALPVVVAPVRSVGREWRYVVVDRRVVAGSAYASGGRSALPDDPGGSPWAFASDLARQIEPPEDVYVMDVCEADGQLWLLELNPFSGADLYACRCQDIVAAVGGAALQATRTHV
jgi:ATP-grasp domain, R2K clade family 3